MSTALVWFRRDLRLHDHAALYQALAKHERVWCAFVFDTDILDPLLQAGLREDRRVAFIHASLAQLDGQLRQRGSALLVRHGSARQAIPQLAAELGVDAVYANRDYEPFARERDAEVARQLRKLGIEFSDWKDQVVFERDEVLTQSGASYGVFTPYKNAWLRKLEEAGEGAVATYPVMQSLDRLAPVAATEEPMPTLASLGFVATALPLPAGPDGAQVLLRDFVARIDDYADKRDFPARKGPSYLSAHLRFGTLSIRQLVAYAWGRVRHRGSKGAEVWLSELIWREFYQMLLWHHRCLPDHCFKPECDRLEWDDAPELFAAWCEGRTGYPLVDAAMRQLNQTGYMHNRLRMMTASFLTKDLGIDWHQGERYFAEQLLDFDLAANNGGWQWAASTGCDAQPWFRIFNPVTQSEKFDPQGVFIRRYVPELAGVADKYIHAPWLMPATEQSRCGVAIGRDYPAPVVDHATARTRTLTRFERLKADEGNAD
ncbi:MAG TPA: deoxyribodipyrimidine photo-lyase [Rhodocyclaceae bacterium]|nr:deoxyribodipyrimidine photo-lyase [Rhodocyclaceae bacterium]